MNTCQRISTLQTQINGVATSASSDLAAAVEDINLQIDQINADIEGIASASSDVGVEQLGALIADPAQLQCCALSGGGNDEMAAILPGGRDFTLCQSEDAWASTTQSFATFMPTGSAWDNATPAAVCTPLPARSGLFGESVLCAASLPQAMAYAVDLRTIKDRCLFVEEDGATFTKTTRTGPTVSLCTHKDTLDEGVFCSTVPKSTCNTTSMYSGLMCTWSVDACKSTKQAGNEMTSDQCTSA
jgi:hypothetical protein